MPENDEGDLMTYVRRLAAIASGMLLLPAALFISSFIPYPSKPYIHDAMVAGLIAPLSFAWAWATLLWIARPAHTAVWWCLSGMIVAAAGLMAAPPWPPEDSVLPYFMYRLYGFGFGYRWWWEAVQMLLLCASGIAAAAAVVMKSKRITVRAAPA
jgi:hypothetical protein